MLQDGVQFYSFVCGYLVSPMLFIEEIVLSPLWVLGALVKNYMTVYGFISV